MRNKTALPSLQHPIVYPGGYDEKTLFDYLSGFRLDGDTSNELEGYLREDFKRFVHTLNLLPTNSAGKKLLEIGANPYFTSILIKKFTEYQLFTTNYFGHNEKSGLQTQVNTKTNEAFEFKFSHHNVETTDIPIDESFDVIIFCEVLEHMVNDPIAALNRIKDKLKPDGTLILSTPNVSRLENISRMISGANIYDPYSGYGPYGRHNREYSQHEVFQLLEHIGFKVELIFSSDVHDNHADAFFSAKRVLALTKTIKNRDHGLGQYIFARAINTKQRNTLKPKWLYRSYPESELT